MTPETFLGGLMILTMVAGIVIAMTSPRDSDNGRFGADDDRSDGLDARRSDRRD